MPERQLAHIPNTGIQPAHVEMEDDEVSIELPPIPRQQKHPRPDNLRSSTDPIPAVLVQDLHDFNQPSSSHHRNRSPYSRSHLRSRSTGAAALSAPLMARAHSMPSPRSSDGALSNTTPSSGSLSPSPTVRSPARARSPFKTEEGRRSPSWMESAGTIQEDTELHLTPRGTQSQSLQPFHPTPISHSSSRSNSLRSMSASLGRRPASPSHAFPNTPASAPSFPAAVIDQNAVINMSSHSASSSPHLGPTRYNEAYPTLTHYGSNSSFSSFSFPNSNSSFPSTPTSARSRSPSISSLETIEDAPEQESEAEAEAVERLKLAAIMEADSDSENEGTRRRSLDAPRVSSRRLGLGGDGGRKRWSVCGGERRGDLDLETIWED